MYKSCDVGEYLDYKNGKCRNKLVEELVEECSENNDGNKMLMHNETLDVIPLNDYKKNMYFLHNTPSIIYCIFHKKHMHWQCLKNNNV